MAMFDEFTNRTPEKLTLSPDRCSAESSLQRFQILSELRIIRQANHRHLF